MKEFKHRERILISKETIDITEFDNKTLSEFIAYLNNLREYYKINFPNEEPILSVDYYGDTSGCEFLIKSLRRCE